MYHGRPIARSPPPQQCVCWPGSLAGPVSALSSEPPPSSRLAVPTEEGLWRVSRRKSLTLQASPRPLPWRSRTSRSQSQRGSPMHRQRRRSKGTVPSPELRTRLQAPAARPHATAGRHVRHDRIPPRRPARLALSAPGLRCRISSPQLLLLLRAPLQLIMQPFSL